jgi:membrane protein required for colicin V production
MTPMMIDSIVLIVILLSAIFATLRGFVRELLTIVNLVGAAAAAWVFADRMLPVTDGWLGVDRSLPAEELDKLPKVFGVVPPELMSGFLSYAVIFFGVFIILSLAGMSIAGAVKALGLGPIDKLLGFVFGALRGALVVFLFYLPFGYFMNYDELAPWAKNSVSVPLLEKTYVAFEARTADGTEDLREAGDELRGRLEDAGENVSDDVRDAGSEVREKTRDILTDDERAEPAR